jgi:nucleoside-diphosphate-sugar epimerase
MIFILGGKGFVGSAFRRACEQDGIAHVVLEPDNYAQHIGQACELFINADGNSRKYLAVEKPLWEFDASVRSVRQTLTDFAFETYLHISTCDVYPDCSGPETTREDQPLAVERQSPYGFHKYLAEQCVRHGARRWLVVRCGGFVGPGMKKNAIYDILQGGPLWLDPQSELQYIHTDDAARIAMSLARSGLQNEVVNLCGKGVVALAEVIAQVRKPVTVQSGSPRARYEVNIEKLAKLVGVPETRDSVLRFVNQMLEADDDHHADSSPS